ncbi:DUF434 domain-containing protein [Clostridium thailandense]|uniref:DUF434 domain-containing protein n=1 Tax=Clostridium thailandense TaxID=2794346 RepID=UPI00398A14E0
MNSDEMLISRISKRGVDPQDYRWFSKEAVLKLQKAQEEVEWLLNRNYKINGVMELVGGHYQLSARQRQALKRSTSNVYECEKRKLNMLPYSAAKDGTIYIDGFNLIITLEVALSGGILMLANDGSIRDIAGLQGSYRLIDKTDKALELIGKSFSELKVSRAKFFLDAPVSNSGRLKEKILKHSLQWSFFTEVELVPNVDPILWKLGRVVTGDSIILDNCESWFNISRKIIEDYIINANLIDLSGKRINIT